ncbi:MAG: hypothetical protein HKN96_02370 [Flavobacteriaceae bacterium]|nr:hypothetical protein [Flavobacteriaceae bacterium]
MEALKHKNQQDPLFIAWKNRSVEFMKAYQDQSVKSMLANCSKDCQIAFNPLGQQGKGNVHEVGKAIWVSLIDSFPSLDNTINAVIKENDSIRCEVTIHGKQEKDFGDLKTKGHAFEEDHIFIFKMDDKGFINDISIYWNHENFIKQLTA